MNETKKTTEYLEPELCEILRGDVIQWRGNVFCVLSVDDNEVGNDIKGGQIYLWVCHGDNMRTRGRRKSIQGLPGLRILRRRTEGAPLGYNQADDPTYAANDGPDDFDDDKRDS